MTTKPTLVVMAAGMGSRYGGLKQMDTITENGEVLLDFSVYDALAAGFGKIILVIKHEIERDFDEAVGKRLRQQADITYVYQELTDLPGGIESGMQTNGLPQLNPDIRAALGFRLKPWGTGHAVLAARGAVNEPFAVINADDYYGKQAFFVMADFLKNEAAPGRYGMVGYQLGQTLTDHGSVARGVCTVEDGVLRGMVEHTKIIKQGGGAVSLLPDGSTVQLPLDTTVSMTLFGFHPSVFGELEEGFFAFLASLSDPQKGEYLLPSRIGELVTQNRAAMRVLKSPDRWFGVTYKEDKPAVSAAIQELRERGVYPERLWL